MRVDLKSLKNRKDFDMRKFLSLFLCVCFVFGMSFSVSAATENTPNTINELVVSENSEVIVSKDMNSGTISYSTFDYAPASTTYTLGTRGEVSQGWFPDASTSETDGAFTHSVIGSDGRKKVSNTKAYPYSAICYIEIDWPDGSTGLGTAWMIYSDIAITAGHCVYSSEHGGWAEKIKLWPGKDGFGLWNNPYGTTETTTLHAASQWTESEDGEHDWAVLELEDDIGNKTGWFGLGWTSADLTGTNVTISGYPGEHRYYQYEMSDKITRCSTNKLFYNVIDTSEGQSGSPIYTSDNIAYGIHCHGVNGNNENSGTRITEWRFNYFKSFKD